MAFRRSRTVCLVGIIAVIAAVPAWPDDSLMDVAASADLGKLVKVTGTGKPSEKGEGPVPYLAKLSEPPKRVALISFYVSDEGESTGSYYSSVRSFTSLTQDGASHFATAYYEKGLAALRETFSKHGMQVLTSAEFLDTEAKKQAYLASALDMSAATKIGLKMIGNMAKAAKGDTKSSAVAAGYRMLPTHQVPSDPKMAVSLDGLRKGLGVDALLIVKNGSLSDGGEVRLADIHIMLYGPNPIPKVEGKSYIQYKEGQLYVDAILRLKKPAQVAVLQKKGGISSEEYEGYEKLLAAAAERTASHLVEKIKDE